MKKYSLFLFISAAFTLISCESEQLITLVDDSIDFRLFNYTDRSYENGELVIGGLTSNGEFIPSESIEYVYVPSNLSPTDTYTDLDNCNFGCGNEGLIDGYHYFTSQGDFFVEIPFTPINNQWNPNLNDILDISDTMALVFRLPDGTEEMLGQLNLRRTFVENQIPVNVIMTIYIRDNGIEGGPVF